MPVASDDILSELRELRRSLSGRVGKGAASPLGDDEVWLLYARSERLAAILKFRLGVERPGVFLELPRSQTPEDFLPQALDQMTAAIDSLETGEQSLALERVRGARTALRAYLAEKRRVRMRVRRKASPTRRTSSTS